MMLADEERRFVAANSAACLLLRLAEADVVRLRVDDVTPPENRANIDALWEAFLRDGVQEGAFELMMPDGARLEVEYSATASVEPGLHLSILMFSPGGAARRSEPSEARQTLTEREREVLGMVAGGRGTSWIASELDVSSSTVETHVRHVLEKLGPAIARTRSRSAWNEARSAWTSGPSILDIGDRRAAAPRPQSLT